MNGFPPILILLALGLPLVLIAQRLGIGALLAYLVTGALAGPHGPLQLVHSEDLHIVAEIGASLLLFSLGLELDLHAMRRRLRSTAVGALGQMGLTIGAGTVLARMLGLDWGPAVATGACLSLSSTLLVLRALDERGLRHRDEGQTVVGLLLGQDLLLAPLLVMVAFAMPQAGKPPGVPAIVAAIACIGAAFLLRRVLASALLARIRAAQLPELEVAFSVTIALGAAALTQSAGIGAAAGAFCAGLALGGDEHRTAIESSTRPLQGLMAILFFVSIGVLFDASFIVRFPLEVLGGLVICIVLKAALGAAALRLAGLDSRAALGCGLMTGQIGEFSFVIAGAAFGGSADPQLAHLYQLIVVVACLSLAATPLLVRLAVPLLPKSGAAAISEAGDTIVVAGLGPVGNAAVEILHRQGYPLLLVDRNPRLLAPWRDTAGVRVHQGRIEDMDDWMPVLGRRPAAVVLTFPVADTSALVAARLRAIDPTMPIVARSPYEAQVDQLRTAGAQFVICDERETTRALLPLIEEALAPRAAATARE